MTGEEFVSRLEKAKRTGRGSWLARCPAHPDRSPSLTVTEKEDGRILAYCHAGCGIEAITESAGVSISDLFPPKAIEHAPRIARPFPVADVLAALADECDVLDIILHDVDWGVPLKQDDIERAQLAIERIRAARSLALGRDE
jgi:hypothetical protein